MFLLTLISTLIFSQFITGSINGAVLHDDSIAGRIVGGENAEEGQFPYQVSLRTLGNFHFCGGSIIGSRWILSAAHCTISRRSEDIIAYCGTLNRIMGGILYGINNIINHADYNAHAISNDICVLRTSKKIEFTLNIKPISLAYKQTEGGSRAVVSGWGQLGNPGSAADTLQFLPKTVLTRLECQKAHIEANRPFIFDSTLCAHGVKNSTGVCFGDSGGPLTVNGFIVGVVSWVIPCARGYPDSYANVSYFEPWIMHHTNNLSED